VREYPSKKILKMKKEKKTKTKNKKMAR